MHEFQLINKYLKPLTFKKSPSLNLSDDVFFDKKNNLIISVDTYNEGVHFLNFNKPELVIKKILRSSISDLICKGVYPKYYFVSVSGNKKSLSSKNLKKIRRSLKEEQKKYKLIIGGGDTTFSNKLSFSISSVGFSNNIISRNNAKLNDDIYVTGNIGDSYIGLLVLKNKIKLNKHLSDYFKNKYYLPDIKYSLTNNLKKIANTSIDLSDGLIADLNKLLNSQKLSYNIYLNDIPISKKLSLLIKNKKIIKKNVISKGDDYEILFTASKYKRNIIKKISKLKKIKITRIGYIKKNSSKSNVLCTNETKISFKNKGYLHSFD